jgi:hypothetical protein
MYVSLVIDQVVPGRYDNPTTLVSTADMGRPQFEMSVLIDMMGSWFATAAYAD